MQCFCRDFQATSVLNVHQQTDDTICEVIFIHYDQRRQICRDEPSCPVSRGDAGAASRERLDDFQGTSADTLIWIDADRTMLKVGTYVLDKIEDRHAGLIEACTACSDCTGIDTSKNPKRRRWYLRANRWVNLIEKLDNARKIRRISKGSQKQNRCIGRRGRV